MGELGQGLLGSLGLLIALVYSVFQWFAGRDKNYLGIRARIWGRIISPLFLSLSIIGLSVLSHRFNWWYFLSVPAYFVAHTIGYGGNTFLKKLFRRTVWSLVRTSCSLTFALFTGAWTLFVLQVAVGLLVTLVLGILNPLKAPVEEGTIKFSNVFLVPLMVI